VWKGGFITCVVFSQFITVFISAILTENTYDYVCGGKHCKSSGHPASISAFVSVIRYP
jgi:hypothetical protein